MAKRGTTAAVGTGTGQGFSGVLGLVRSWDLLPCSAQGCGSLASLHPSPVWGQPHGKPPVTHHEASCALVVAVWCPGSGG